METQKNAPPVRENTDVGLLLRAYVEAYPRKIGGYEESRLYGFKFHTQSQRSGDLTKRGFPVKGTRREGEEYHEFRFSDVRGLREASLLVRSWDSGLTVNELREQDSVISVGQVTRVNDLECQGTLVLSFSPDDPVHPHGRS